MKGLLTEVREGQESKHRTLRQPEALAFCRPVGRREEVLLEPAGALNPTDALGSMNNYGSSYLRMKIQFERAVSGQNWVLEQLPRGGSLWNLSCCKSTV